MGEILKVDDFKNELLLLQSFIYFDDNEFLREKCSNEDFLKDLIGKLDRAILDWNSSLLLDDLLFLYGAVGNLYRIQGEVKSSIDVLTKAVRLSKGNKKIANHIRLGESLKYAGQHQQALTMFNTVIEQCKQQHSVLLDYAYQHKGKCLLELEELSEANECFRKALELRVKKGDLSLIASTQMAIDYIRDR